MTHRFDIHKLGINYSVDRSRKVREGSLAEFMRGLGSSNVLKQQKWELGMQGLIRCALFTPREHYNCNNNTSERLRDNQQKQLSGGAVKWPNHERRAHTHMKWMGAVRDNGIPAWASREEGGNMNPVGVPSPVL